MNDLDKIRKVYTYLLSQSVGSAISVVIRQTARDMSSEVFKAELEEDVISANTAHQYCNDALSLLDSLKVIKRKRGAAEIILNITDTELEARYNRYSRNQNLSAGQERITPPSIDTKLIQDVSKNNIICQTLLAYSHSIEQNTMTPWITFYNQLTENIRVKELIITPDQAEIIKLVGSELQRELVPYLDYSKLVSNQKD